MHTRSLASAPHLQDIKRELKKDADPELSQLLDEVTYEELLNSDNNGFFKRLADAKLGPYLAAMGLNRDPLSFFSEASACHGRMPRVLPLMPPCSLFFFLRQVPAQACACTPRSGSAKKGGPCRWKCGVQLPGYQVRLGSWLSKGTGGLASHVGEARGMQTIKCIPHLWSPSQRSQATYPTKVKCQRKEGCAVDEQSSRRFWSKPGSGPLYNMLTGSGEYGKHNFWISYSNSIVGHVQIQTV
eukprot:1159897-Pelagomonas_calceolata.AAC.3